jgi:NAD(P)-dependent dehydrogenase (short-subunit alcohol dehydrogenase family)
MGLRWDGKIAVATGARTGLGRRIAMARVRMVVGARRRNDRRVWGAAAIPKLAGNASILR